MTANQRLIAEHAIDRRWAATFDLIKTEVSHMTGIAISEISATLDYLTRECIIRECSNPARNVNEQPVPVDNIRWAWYEKGECWPQ